MNNPFLDLCDKYWDILLLWALVALFPFIAAAAIRATHINRIRGPAIVQVVGAIFGYFAIFILFVALPWVAFDTYIVPILFDYIPATRYYLAPIFAILRFLAKNWPLIFPVIWPCWVLWILFRKIRQGL